MLYEIWYQCCSVNFPSTRWMPESFVCVMLQLLFINIVMDHSMKKFLSNFQTLIVPKKCLRQGTPTTITDVAVGFLYDFYCDRHMMILHEEFKFAVDILVHYWCCNSYFQILLWRAYDDFTMFNLVQYVWLWLSFSVHLSCEATL